MPKFAANLTFLFKEFPCLERIAEARAAGFEAVEILFPYDEAASEIARRMAEAGLDMALINTPPPNWAGGDRGFAAIPNGEARFQKDFTRAMRFATLLRAQHVHIMAGKARGFVARDTFVRNLRWACDQAPEQSLTIEPINPVDMPGYFLADFEEAAAIIAEVDRPNLGLQFDAYHAQIITGDAIETYKTYADLVRHIQIASLPGRNEPDRGEIDYPAFFELLDESGYKGWVSGEYMPRGRTAEGLNWAGLSAKAKA